MPRSRVSPSVFAPRPRAGLVAPPSIKPPPRRTPRVEPIARSAPGVLPPPRFVSPKAVAARKRVASADRQAIQHVLALPPKQVLSYRPGGPGTAPLGFITASRIANYKSGVARANEISRFANEINNSGTLTAKSVLQAKRRMRSDPHFQSDLNKQVNALAQAHEARSQGSVAGVIGSTIHNLANPLEWVYGGVQGIQELRKRQYASGAIDLAGLVPMLRPLRGARAVLEGMRTAAEGEKATVAARAAMQSWREGKGVILPTVRAAAKLGRSKFGTLPERQILVQAVKESTTSPAEAKLVIDHFDAQVHEQTQGLRGSALRRKAADVYREIHTHSVTPGDPFHRFNAEETAAHMRSKVNPANADKGLPVSPKRFGTVNGVPNIVVSGQPTVQEWTSRVLAAVPDQAERLKWKNWYDEIWPLLKEHFGGDAIWILRGFGASQANASPAQGLTAVLRMMDDLKRGIPVTREDALRYSAVSHSIMDAVRGTPVEAGVAKKLSDFIDAVQGRSTRTIMGHDEAGGMPSPIDIHSGRDFGFVDNKLVNRLQSLHGLTPGKDFSVDMGDGVPGTVQYERAAEFYHQVADHLNQTRFDGHQNWTPAEVQALGWGAIQKVHGADPEDMAFALNRNTTQIALEVLNGTRRLGSGLPFAVQQQVTKDVAQAILPRLLSEENVYVQKIEFGAGGWEGGQSPNLVAHVIATPEQVDRIVSRAAHIFDQHDVWGVRVGVQVTKRKVGEWTSQIGRPARALEVTSPEFSSATTVRDFWNQFLERLPAKERKNFPGYSTFTAPDGSMGIRVITPIGAAGKPQLEAWLRKLDLENVIGDAAGASGVREFDYNTTNVEVRDARGAVARAAERRKGDVQRPPGSPGVRADLGDPLAAEARQVTEEAIARHGRVGPRLRPGGVSRIAPRPEMEPGAGGYPAEQPLGQSADPGERLAARLQTEQVGPELPPEATPAEQLVSRMKGAGIVTGREKALRSREMAERIRIATEEMRKHYSPLEAHFAAKEALRGQYPKLNWRGFTEMNADAIDAIFQEIDHRFKTGELQFWEKTRATDAILRGLQGIAPQKAERELLTKIFGEDFTGQVVQSIPIWRKAGGALLDAALLPRTLAASMDLSAPFRQGLLAGVYNPRLFFSNFGDMVRAFGSENVFQQIQHQIETDPLYESFIGAGGSITDPARSYNAREEAFMSRLAERIPGVRASERAYVGFLNKTRFDLYKYMLEQAHMQNIDISDPKQLKSIARAINNMTGRGDLGKLGEHLGAMNAIFFAPRFMAARFNMINPVWYMTLTPFARRQALRASLSLVGTGMAVLAMARLAGAKVGLDPRSADFGKIRIGNTRIDIWGGFQQWARLIGTIIKGESVSSTTGQVTHLPWLPKSSFARSRLGEVTRFFAGKTSPITSLAIDAFAPTLKGPIRADLKKQLETMWIPLLWRDWNAIYRKPGGAWYQPAGPAQIAESVAATVPSMFGVGTSSYGARPAKPTGSPFGGGFGGSGAFSGGFGP
jgi:hypothetical protein